VTVALARASEPDFYELLGVTREADVQQIRAACRRLVRQSHPDAGGSAGMFRLVQQAFETLSDVDTRAAYDGDGSAPHRPPPEPEPANGGQAPPPERWSWWADVEPDAPVAVDPPFHLGRVTAIAVAAPPSGRRALRTRGR